MRHLHGFSVGNFRGFDSLVRVDLAPLTLVFGENNSGKSSLLRLLPLLSESFDPRTSAPLNLDSASIRGADFSDLLCRQTESQGLELGLDWGDASFNAEFRELSGSVRSSRFTLTHGTEQFTGTWSGTDDLYDVGGGTALPVRFRGPVPQADPALPPIVSEISARAEHLPKQVLWLAATREAVRREEPAPRSAPIGLGSRGERAVATCAFDDEVRRWVSSWYERHFGYEFIVQRLARHVRPELRRSSSLTSIPLPDSGEGFSQVLPVVTAVALASLRRGAELLCIEHPELHLHPDAHPAIASLFCELAAAQGPVRVLVETHSEILLLATLLAVAEGRLATDSVTIYWVRQRTDGTSAADKVTLEPGARLGPEFPPGAFGQHSELARKLVRRRQMAQ